MFNRLKALVWLRNQTIIANKNLLVQVLMPYGLLFIYKNFMNLGDDKGLDLMFLCLSTAIAMSVGSTVSTIIAEEKEKNNLKNAFTKWCTAIRISYLGFSTSSRNYYFKYDFVPYYCRRRYF